MTYIGSRICRSRPTLLNYESSTFYSYCFVSGFLSKFNKTLICKKIFRQSLSLTFSLSLSLFLYLSPLLFISVQFTKPSDLSGLRVLGSHGGGRGWHLELKSKKISKMSYSLTLECEIYKLIHIVHWINDQKKDGVNKLRLEIFT